MKVLASDLDDTLINYPFISKIPWTPLRMLGIGIITRLSPGLQLRLARPSPTYEKIKKSKVELIVVSGRTKYLNEPFKTIIKLLNHLPKEIHLKKEGVSRFEHKEKTLEKLQEKYEVIAYIEDEPKARRILRESEKIDMDIIPPEPDKLDL